MTLLSKPTSPRASRFHPVVAKAGLLPGSATGGRLPARAMDLAWLCSLNTNKASAHSPGESRACPADLAQTWPHMVPRRQERRNPASRPGPGHSKDGPRKPTSTSRQALRTQRPGRHRAPVRLSRMCRGCCSL